VHYTNFINMELYSLYQTHENYINQDTFAFELNLIKNDKIYSKKSKWEFLYICFIFKIELRKKTIKY
jgi:hypothetical protein